ncbi:hypothetical protein D3C84_872380 [compost metagenome]
MTHSLAQGQTDVVLVRLDTVDARQASNWGKRACWVEGYVPSSCLGQQVQRERGELQACLEAPGTLIQRGRFDVKSEFRQVCVHEALGVLLGPAEALANEEPLIADRHVLAGHGVVGQPTDVAAVTQHK